MWLEWPSPWPSYSASSLGALADELAIIGGNWRLLLQEEDPIQIPLESPFPYEQNFACIVLIWCTVVRLVPVQTDACIYNLVHVLYLWNLYTTCTCACRLHVFFFVCWNLLEVEIKFFLHKQWTNLCSTCMFSFSICLIFEGHLLNLSLNLIV